MPYIPRKRRTCLKWILNRLLTELGGLENPNIDGELNYCFTYLLRSIFESEKNYRNLQRMIGILECCKLELYRVVLSPYEEAKRRERGDIFE